MKIEKTIKFIASECGKVVFIVGSIFPVSACLFVFGEEGLEQLPYFINKSKKVLPDYDISVWLENLTKGSNANLIKDGYSFCTPMEDNWESHCIFVNDRNNNESTLLHEIIHLVDSIIDLSGLSNDTEARAYLFNYYEQTFKQIRQ